MSKTPRFTVEIYHDLAPYLAGISSKEFFLDADKLIKAWKVTTEWTLDTFHGRLKPRTPTAAPNSYGTILKAPNLISRRLPSRWMKLSSGLKQHAE